MSARHDRSGLALGIWSALVFVFLFLPIAVVVVYSFNAGRLLESWDGFSTRPFHAIVDQPDVRHAVLVSVETGVIAAVVATLLGTLAGIALARRPGRWSRGFILLLLLVSVTPEIVDAIGLLPWFVWLSDSMHLSTFSNGIVRLVVGHTLFSVAVVSYLVRARLVGLDEALEEASADLYARPLTTFRRITLPLVMPAVVAGGLLSFTLSLDNTIIASFVTTAGNTSWPVYVLSALRSGLRPDLAAVSTILLVFTLLALGLVALVFRRAGASTTQVVQTMAGD